MSTENLASLRIQSPDRSACSESLNQVRYHGPQLYAVVGNKTGVQKTTAQNMRNIKCK